MSNDFPIWGCPWHGKITGGRLELPDGTEAQHNGEPLQVRQPGGALPMLRGKCTPVSMPGATGSDDTEPDENGQHFRKTAFLAHDQLHGKTMPAGSWIYHDSEGVNWLVSCNLHGYRPLSSGQMMRFVTLTRFGRTATPDEMPSTRYFFQVPAMIGDIDAGNYINISRYYQAATSLQGDRACFGFYRTTDNAIPNTQSYGFLEIVLSGPGDDVQVTAAWAKSFTECMASYESFKALPRRITTMWRGVSSGPINIIPETGPPECEGLWETTYTYETTDDIRYYQLRIEGYYPQGVHQGDSSRVIPLCPFYKENGELDFLYGKIELTTTVTSSGLDVVISPGVRQRTFSYDSWANACGIDYTNISISEITVTYSYTAVIQSGIKIKVGESGIYKEIYSRQDTTQYNLAVISYGGNSSYTEDYTYTSSEGDILTSSYSRESTQLNVEIFPRYQVEQGSDSTLSYNYAPVRRNGPEFRWNLYALSPSLLAVLRTVVARNNDGNLNKIIQLQPTVATPAGTVEIEGLTLPETAFADAQAIYGAYNPITGEAVIDTTPVNFM